MYKHVGVFAGIILFAASFFPLTSTTTTPRRKLSLEMDENARSPFTSEQDDGKEGKCVHLWSRVCV